MRERMILLDYLETKEKRKISKISKKACIQLYQEMSNEKKRKRTSKKKLLNHLLFLRKQKKEENSPKENYDLFGNEICSPVRGFDDKIYDFRSMVKQFQIDAKKNTNLFRILPMTYLIFRRLVIPNAWKDFI